jgi:predicted membrane channel-forming protein YqfA (hemolysin III family)
VEDRWTFSFLFIINLLGLFGGICIGMEWSSEKRVILEFYVCHTWVFA